MPQSLHATLAKAFCNPSSSNNLTPFPSNSSYISNSLSSLDCSGRERYGDLASLLVVAVSTGVDLEVEEALSSPVTTVVVRVVRKEGMLSFLDETVGSVAGFSFSVAVLTGGRRFLLHMVLDFVPGRHG